MMGDDVENKQDITINFIKNGIEWGKMLNKVGEVSEE